MPPEAPTSPSAAPATIKNIKEDDDSHAGSMTLLLPQKVLLTHQPATGKQADQRLPMPSLQRPRRRIVVRTPQTPSAGHCTTWVLALLAAAAVMAAVAAAAMAMAARAEIFRLRAEVDNIRTRLAYHETLQDTHRMLELGMEPVPEEDEDVIWEQGEQATDDLSPLYPEVNEFEFAADVKGSSASSRHSRRHIPTVSASYESSENGWRPGKPEKRLKLYETLESGTSPPKPAELPKKVPDDAYARPYHHRSSGGRLVAAMAAPQAQRAPPVPAMTSSSTTDKVIVARRSRVMEHQTRNDASWRQRNQMHIQHHLQRQQNSSTSKLAALLMEFSGKVEETRGKKVDARNVDAVAAHFTIDANRRSKSVSSKTEQPVSWCSGSWMSQYGQNEHFSVQSSSGLSSIIVRSPGIYYVYAQGDSEANGLLLQRNGRRQASCRTPPGSTCFTASIVALSAGDNLTVRGVDGHPLTNSSASMGFIRLSCPKSNYCD